MLDLGDGIISIKMYMAFPLKVHISLQPQTPTRAAPKRTAAERKAFDVQNTMNIDDDSDDDFDLCMSIDESDKQRFFSMRENGQQKFTPKIIDLNIESNNIMTKDDVEIHLEPTEEMELYTQDMESMAEIIRMSQCQRAKRDKTFNEPTLAVQQFSLNEDDSAIPDIMGLPISKITQSGKNFKLFHLESSYIVSRFYSVLIAFMQTYRRNKNSGINWKNYFLINLFVPF